MHFVDAPGHASGQGTSDIGIGTVLGSAVFNLTVIVGVLGLARPFDLDRNVVWRDGLVYALSVLALVGAIAFGLHEISRIEALLMLTGYVVYLIWIARDTRRHSPPTDTRGQASSRGAWTTLTLTVLVLGVTCHFLVASTSALATDLATWAGVSASTTASVVSLFVVAAGTSVPDLLTSIAALRHGRGSMAVGNAIGSNTFDLLVCLGLPYAVLDAPSVSGEIVFSVWYLLGTVLVFLALVATRRRLQRTHGVVLLAAYVAFVVFVGWTLARGT